MFEGEDKKAVDSLAFHEQTLRREAQIEALLEAVPDALFTVDGEWRITLMNPAAQTFFLRNRDDLVGRVLWDVFPEAIGTATEDLLRAAMAGESQSGIELESVTRPGRFVHLRLTRKATGGLALVFTDVTDQRLAQARERAQAEDFRALADNIPALCWMTYADGHVYWFNSRWYDFTGADPETQIGWGWESAHDPAVLPAVQERWKSSLSSGEPFEMVFPLRRKDGVFLPFLVRAVPVRNGAGEIVRWFGSCTEVADQVRQQQRLRTMVDELNHRVKNTLATIQSLAANSMRKAPDIETGYKAFEARLMTLSAAHNILTEERWEGADLETLLRAAIEPFADARDGRTTFDGVPVRLSPASALDLSLIVHELATNATKYGAFANDVGTVTLSWRLSLVGEHRRLNLTWLERHGPEVAMPIQTGFGSRLIKRIVQDEGGTAELTFDRAGLRCTIELPLQEAREPLQPRGQGSLEDFRTAT